MTEKCFYCKKNEANPEHAYSHKMYFVHNRMKLLPGFRYSEKEIKIPRCKECYDKCVNFGTPFFWGLLISAFIISIWFCYKFVETLFRWIFGVIVITLFIFGPIWYIFRTCFFTKYTGIPVEEEFDEFPLAAQLLKEGWVKSRPDPGSHPNTGHENITENLTSEKLEEQQKIETLEDEQKQ